MLGTVEETGRRQGWRTCGWSGYLPAKDPVAPGNAPDVARIDLPAGLKIGYVHDSYTIFQWCGRLACEQAGFSPRQFGKVLGRVRQQNWLRHLVNSAVLAEAVRDKQLAESPCTGRPGLFPTFYQEITVDLCSQTWRYPPFSGLMNLEKHLYKRAG